MFSVVFALIFIAVAAAVTLIAWWSAPNHKHSQLDPETIDVLVDLHRIRRRFDVFFFKIEVDRRTQRAERELRRELDEHKGG